MKPGYQALAEAHTISEPFRYIYPPPSVLLLVPFGSLTRDVSLVTFWAVSALACWVSGVMSGSIYSHLTGRRDWVWAVVVIGVAWCPLTWAAVRVANTSCLIAGCVSLMLYGLLRKTVAPAAVGFYLGAAPKFVTIPLLAIPVLLGRLRITLWCVAVSVVFTAGTVAATGIDLWEEYIRIFPALGRPNGYPINISLLSLINQLCSPGSRSAWASARTGAMAITLVVILAGLWRNRRVAADGWAVMAGASALLGWFLIFAPTTQNHYFVYLYPLWGYYAAECRNGWAGRLAAVVIIVGTFVPLGGSGRALPLAVQFHLLYAAGVALAFGIFRLFRPVQS